MRLYSSRLATILGTAFLTVLGGCYGGVYIGVGDEVHPPSVGLFAAPDQFSTPGTLTLSAGVTAERPVNEVQFFERTPGGSVLLASDTSPPFEITVAIDERDNGTLQFFATAVDSGGLAGTSATVFVQVAIPTP